MFAKRGVFAKLKSFSLTQIVLSYVKYLRIERTSFFFYREVKRTHKCPKIAST